MARADKLLIAAVSVMAFFAVGCELQTKTNNPDYTCWEEFPPGSSVTFEGLQRIGDGNPEATTLTIELIDINDEQAVLRRTVNFPSRTDAQPQSQVSVEPHKIDRGDHPKTHSKTKKNFKGWGSVIVEDKTYPCNIWEYRTSHSVEKLGIDENADLLIKAWENDDIPGGIARIEYHAKTPHQQYQIAGEVVTFHIEPEQPKATKTPAPKAAKKAPPTPTTKSAKKPEEASAATPTTKPTTQPVLPELESIKLEMETAAPMAPPTPEPAKAKEGETK